MKKDKEVTLKDIMRLVERDNRCANAALIISIISILLIIICALLKIFQPVGP